MSSSDLISGKKFLLNTITAWDEPPRARHQLAFSLAKKHEVIFVTRNRKGLPGIKIYSPEKNITVIEPSFPIDYKFRYRIPGINELYQFWLFSRLKKITDFDYCINFDFTATLIYIFFNSVVYYCNDEFIGNSNVPSRIVDFYHKICENRVIRKAGFCVATAGFLVEKLKRLNTQTFLIPLGGPNLNEIGVEPGKVIQGDAITLSLIYVITRHLDHELINDLLKRGNIKIVCIGPRDFNFESKVINHENIKFTGILKNVELYRELNKADIGLAPYIVEKVNQGGTPNKLWQYFAVGKPLVISDLPNLAGMKFPEKSVYIYKSGDEIFDLVKQAHCENNDELVEKRTEFAGLNSWDSRIEKFLEVLSRFFI